MFFKDNQVLLVYFWKKYAENFNISSVIKVQSFYHFPFPHRKFLQTTCFLYVFYMGKEPKWQNIHADRSRLIKI